MAGDDTFDEETFDDGSENTLEASYPPLAPRGSAAKDWDSCLLQDFSAKRIRLLAKTFPGIDSHLNKAGMFKAICDALADEVEWIG